MSRFAEVLPGIVWGMSHEQVFSFHEQIIWKKFNERKVAIKDILEIETARKRAAAEIEKLRSEYVEFLPETETYRVSIIENEFAVGTGEAVFRYEDGEGDDQRYYFFLRDRLWKVFVVYNTAFVRKLPFNSYLTAQIGLFGEPARLRRDTRQIEGERVEVPVEAIWEDDRYRVRTSDQMTFYGTYVMVVSDRQTEDRLSELRGQAGAQAEAQEVSDPAVRSLLQDITTTDQGKSDSDIVDQILGEKTQVEVGVQKTVSEDDFAPVSGSTLLPEKKPKKQ